MAAYCGRKDDSGPLSLGVSNSAQSCAVLHSGTLTGLLKNCKIEML